jgi:ABC-type nitrate/sulfonate/bicarbonate transport system permease component
MRRLSGFLLVAALLGVWEISADSGLVNSSNWPPFGAVLVALANGVMSGEFPALLGTTLRHMLLGYAVGSATAILLGLALGASRILRELFNAPIELLRPLPLTAIIPPLVVFLGIGDALKIFVVAFATFFPVLISTLDGTRAASATLLQTAQTFRLRPWRVVVSVLLPSALPSVFAGLRTSLSIALVLTITAEMIVGAGGLGYFIVQSQYAMLPAPLYASVICLAAAGYLMNRLFLMAERAIIPWYYTHFA